MFTSLVSASFPGNIGGDDLDPGCPIPAIFPKKDDGGAAAAVALEPIPELDPGVVAESFPLPLNIGPMPSSNNPDKEGEEWKGGDDSDELKPKPIIAPIQWPAEPTDDDDDASLSKSNDPRAKRLGHLRDFIGWSTIAPEFTETGLRRQAMKARRLSRIMGEGWSVQFSPGTYTCNDEDDEATQEAMKAATMGHMFFVWPNWFHDAETWGDDRAELGPMEDQIAKQLDAHAKRFSDAAKKLRDASAQAEFIKSRMQARKAAPCNPSNDAVQLADELAALDQQGLIAIGDDNTITALDDIPTAEEIEQRAQAPQPTILDDDDKQFFDQCMIRGMDELLRGNSKKRELLLMASDSDCMSGNDTNKSWNYLRDCILRIRGAALMLTHTRRAVHSGVDDVGRVSDAKEISAKGIDWLLDFYKEKQ